MRYIPFTFIFVLAPIFAQAAIVNINSVTTNTGNITVSSGASSSASSASVRTVVNSGSGGTATIEIITEENGVRSIEKKIEQMKPGTSVNVSVSTSTGSSKSSASVSVGRASSKSSVTITSTTSNAGSPSGSKIPWLFKPFHEIMALFGRIFTTPLW